MASSSSSDSPPPPPVPVPVTSRSPSPGHLNYKNRLQELLCKSGQEVPVYQTVNEGQDHFPKFRSSVSVVGISYTSESTFRHKKAAEQDAARLALETILQKTREEAPSIVSEVGVAVPNNHISPFFKSIINEYANKMYIKPSYNTVGQQLSVLAGYTSSLVLNGTSYTGDPARTRKEAEQLAAEAAIRSIMGDSSSGSELIEIIKSKSMFYDAIKGRGLSLLQASEVLSTPNSEHISVTVDPKEAVVQDSVADDSEVKVDSPESSKIHSTCQKNQIPNQESSPQATLPLQPDSAHSIDDDLSSKKRKKNKEKANKKSRLESPITEVPTNQSPPCTSVPLNQVPPCSVSQ